MSFWGSRRAFSRGPSEIYSLLTALFRSLTRESIHVRRIAEVATKGRMTHSIGIYLSSKESKGKTKFRMNERKKIQKRKMKRVRPASAHEIPVFTRG